MHRKAHFYYQKEWSVFILLWLTGYKDDDLHFHSIHKLSWRSAVIRNLTSMFSQHGRKYLMLTKCNSRHQHDELHSTYLITLAMHLKIQIQIIKYSPGTIVLWNRCICILPTSNVKWWAPGWVRNRENECTSKLTKWLWKNTYKDRIRYGF